MIVAQAQEPGEFEMNELYLNLLKTIYNGTVSSGEARGEAIDIPTTLDNARVFMDGIFEGYGLKLPGYNSSAFTLAEGPDYDKLAHIERNVYSFSGAKNYQQLRDLTSALKDGDRVLPFREFKNKALTILDEYQGNWLRTEYNVAVSGAQMASKWVDFQKSVTQSSPMGALLEYRTMEDERVRDEHRLLDRITRPVTDAFWKTYYPPNGWNCRCTVIRLNTGTPTPDNKMEYPDIPIIFQSNLGQEGLVFPEKHPYFIGCPKDVIKQATNLIPKR